MQVLDTISVILGITGSIVIIWGVIVTTYGFVRDEYNRIKGSQRMGGHYYLRFEMGTYLLLGLEFLVAADIVRTLIRPDLDGIIILGLVVIIRTIVSYFLSRDVETYEQRLEKNNK
jgi:uncharacterized membrane protein